MDWMDYRKKLGVGLFDEEKCNFCSSIMLNKIDDLHNTRVAELDLPFLLDFEAISEEEYKRFCAETGTQYGDILSTAESKIVECLRKNKPDFRRFLAFFVSFVNCLDDREKGIKKAELLGIAISASEESKLKLAILKDEDNYFVFPKGAQELDDALVSRPLEWLSAYPQAQKTFVIALEQYSDGVYIRDVADNLRKALEAFLQEFLDNTKNLETNKNEICKYLGEQGVDAGISGLFQPLINAYKNINDRIAKHNDAVDEKLLEFLLYQTGVLIRMVLVVDKEGKSDET